MIKLKLNKNIRTPEGLKNSGLIIELDSDCNGIPLNRFWRDRLKDSAMDNCVELVTEIINKKKKSK